MPFRVLAQGQGLGEVEVVLELQPVVVLQVSLGSQLMSFYRGGR